MKKRIILHSDLNNFYASVECLYHPEYRGKPLAVLGDPEARHGVVLAKNILDMGQHRFTVDYCKWAKKKGYRLCERNAKKIFALAQNGIPVLPNTQSTNIVVTEAVRVIYELELSRDTILAQMQTFAKTLPEYSIVRNMPCIGDTLAPRIITEIGDVRRFNNKYSLIAYAGIDPPPYQSGKFCAS